jgi:hypothetical protein
MTTSSSFQSIPVLLSGQAGIETPAAPSAFSIIVVP